MFFMKLHILNPWRASQGNIGMKVSDTTNTYVKNDLPEPEKLQWSGCQMTCQIERGDQG